MGELRITSNTALPDSRWDEFVDRLVCLLSLAHRNYVAKVSKQRYDDENQPHSQIFYGLEPRSTRVAKRPLISTDDLSGYLTQTSSYFAEVFAPWKLGIAMDHYFRALDSLSGWPMGTGIIVALECLVSAYISSQGNEFHFSDEMEKEIDPLLEQLAKLTLNFLNTHFPERVKQLRADRSEMQSWETSLRNLNRRSFKRKMRSMLTTLDVKPPNSEVLQRYIDIRNDLVHYGYPVSQDWSREFRKIMELAEFLEEIFLAILQYKGPVQKINFQSTA